MLFRAAAFPGVVSILPHSARPAPTKKLTSWLIAGGLLLVAGMARPLSAADLNEPVEAPKRWVIDYTSAMLWKAGGGATPLSYRLLPQIISVLCPPITEQPFAGGTLVMRTRLSLLLEPIITGPETYFIGTAAAGDLEWRNRSGRFACFFAGGGGFGLMDSRGYQVKGAQGQDFNLNWLLHAGIRVRAHGDWRWSAGVYFQHISNGGMNKVNPGLNAVGPALGLSRPF
ncbi:MAG TPA: acyloxyacyl hydrolase [Opitutaceae bacterium]|jgi:lipid A 3-O-deacylase|nr:acyloxyacyl hydrolase [Opitutaceae bacterium]